MPIGSRACLHVHCLVGVGVCGWVGLVHRDVCRFFSSSSGRCAMVRSLLWAGIPRQVCWSVSLCRLPARFGGVGAMVTFVESLILAQDERWRRRSEEHTSELQSRQYLVCRLLLE